MTAMVHILVFTAFLLLPKQTESKVLETTSFKYKTPIETQYVHRYSTKLSWSKTRQDVLDDRANTAKRNSDVTGKPMKMVTDQVINDRSTDDRFRGRVALTETIGSVIHHELLAALLTEMSSKEDRAFIQRYRKTASELKLRCYTSGKSAKVVECHCDAFVSAPEVLGMGFNLRVALLSDLVTQDVVVEEGYTDGSIMEKFESVVTEESTYQMDILVHFVTERGSDRIVDRVIKRTNSMLAVPHADVSRSAVQNLEVNILTIDEKKAYFKKYDDKNKTSSNTQNKRGMTQEEIEAELEYESDVQASLQEQEELQQQKMVEAAARKQRLYKMELREELETIATVFNSRLEAAKQLRKTRSYDESEDEELWDEVEDLLERMKKYDLNSLGFNESAEGRKRKAQLEKMMRIDLDMQRYMLEMSMNEL